MKLPLKISLIVSIVSIVFILFVFNNIHKQLTLSEKTTVTKQYQAELENLKNSLTLILKRAQNTITLIGIANSSVKKEKQVKNLTSRFSYYMKNMPQISELRYISLESEKELLFLSKDRLYTKPTNKSYHNDDSFKKALKYDSYMSDIYFNKTTNEMMIDLYKKVTDINTQKIIAVVLVKFSMNTVQEVISDKLTIFEGISLINRVNDKFLYKSSLINKIDEKVLLANNSIVSNIVHNNENYVLISSLYNKDTMNLEIIILVSENTIFKNISKTLKNNLDFLIIIILLSSIFIFFIVGYILKPLKVLSSDINFLSKKFDSSLKNLDNTEDEIKGLRLYFDIFVGLIEKDRKKLESFNKELKEQVAIEIKKNEENEKLLAHQSKMASMGEMLENIAHQWRQPLSVISTASSGIVMQKEFGTIKDEDEIKMLNNITHSAVHLSKTINDFRDFFKQHKNKILFNVKDAYKRTINLLESKFKNRGIIVVENIEDIEIFNLDSELVQVIMNLLNNSKDALEIKTDNELKIIIVDIFKEMNNVIIKIKDNGGGIDDSIANKIFEPYFTTKHKSQGTGIGLYMSEEIITKHLHGMLSFKNENFTYKNKNYTGACFTITIPITQDSK